MNKFNDTNKEFAILVDSYCKIPEEYLTNYPIYVIPARINNVNKVFEKVINDGYTKILAVNIFGNQSEIDNTLQLMIDKFTAKGMKFFHLDISNIAIASGLYAVSAGKYLKEGKSYEETIDILVEEYETLKAYWRIKEFFYGGNKNYR